MDVGEILDNRQESLPDGITADMLSQALLWTRSLPQSTVQIIRGRQRLCVRSLPELALGAKLLGVGVIR